MDLNVAPDDTDLNKTLKALKNHDPTLTVLDARYKALTVKQAKGISFITRYFSVLISEIINGIEYNEFLEELLLDGNDVIGEQCQALSRYFQVLLKSLTLVLCE